MIDRVVCRSFRRSTDSSVGRPVCIGTAFFAVFVGCQSFWRSSLVRHRCVVVGSSSSSVRRRRFVVVGSSLSVRSRFVVGSSSSVRSRFVVVGSSSSVRRLGSLFVRLWSVVLLASFGRISFLVVSAFILAPAFDSTELCCMRKRNVCLHRRVCMGVHVRRFIQSCVTAVSRCLAGRW
jgi:hypothetical protein